MGVISQKNRDFQRMIAMGYRRAASETYSAECCLRRITLHLKQQVKKDDDGESCRNLENTFDSFTIVTSHAMKLDGNITISQFLRDLSGSRRQRWQDCSLTCAFMLWRKEKLAVLSTEQGANPLALRFHLDSILLLVSKEMESPSFNGETKCAVEPMKKMATDMEHLGAH